MRFIKEELNLIQLLKLTLMLAVGGVFLRITLQLDEIISLLTI
jgi:hypothetical protein